MDGVDVVMGVISGRSDVWTDSGEARAVRAARLFSCEFKDDDLFIYRA